MEKTWKSSKKWVAWCRLQRRNSWKNNTFFVNLHVTKGFVVYLSCMHSTYVNENANTDKSLDVRTDKQHDYLYAIEFNCGYIF